MITTLHTPRESSVQQVETPWHQPPAHLDAFAKEREGKPASWYVDPANHPTGRDLQDWKQACNEIAGLIGEPLPYPPKVLPKGPILKLRHPPAFSFKDTATLLSTEIEQLRTSYATDKELAGLDMCLGGEDCCEYHTRMRQKMDSRIPSVESNLDKDMKRGKPYVCSSGK